MAKTRLGVKPNQSKNARPTSRNQRADLIRKLRNPKLLVEDRTSRQLFRGLAKQLKTKK